MKVLLDDQFSMPGKRDSVNFRRMNGLDRGMNKHPDKSLYTVARNPDIIYETNRLSIL